MSLIESKQVFYINSENRLSGTDSNFQFDLKLTENNFDHAVVLQMSVPKSYYLIQSGYDSFVIEEDKKQATITLDPGNYTRASLKNVLEGKLNTGSPNGYTYTISYPNNNSTQETGKFTFTVTGNSGVQPSFIFNSSSIYKVLGFDYESTNLFVANVLISENVMNLNKETTIFLHSDISTNQYANDVLQEVYGQDSPDFAYITYQCINFEACSKPLINKNGIVHFQLTNEEGTEILLNGQNLLITLLLYKKENFTNLLKNLLKIELLK